MEYDIKTFARLLQDWFVKSPLFPKYNPLTEEDMERMGVFTKSMSRRFQSDESKHPFRNPTHLSEAVERCFSITTIQIGDDQVIFDLGSEEMERTHPYYHILENAPVIRKRNRATIKTRGSEHGYKNVSERDYERVIWNGKTFTKEYSKNVRGMRKRNGFVSHWGINDKLEGEWFNKDSNSYLNVHYRYIENTLEQDVNYKLANTFGLTLGRTQSTGLVDEFATQQETSIENIVSIFDSFA